MSTVATPPVDLVSLFQSFCLVGDPVWGVPRLMWSLAGSDGTQTWENRMHATLGDERYESLHWVLIALDGKMILAAPRTKPAGVEPLPLIAGTPTAMIRTMLSIDEHSTSAVKYESETPVPEAGKHAVVSVLGRIVADEYIAKIQTLPNPRFCGPAVEGCDPVYFRFDGGVGAVMPLRY